MAAVVISFRVFRIIGNGQGKVGNGPGQAAFPGIGDPAVIIGLCKIGIGVDGLGIVRNSLIKIALLEGIIAAIYILHRCLGINGNAYGAGVVTTINSVLYDDNAVPRALTVTNEDSILGGVDAETIDQIRFNAPRVFNAGDRLVTKADHIAASQHIEQR